RDDAYGFAAPQVSELDPACDQSKQSVVTASTDVVTGVETGTALANQDLASLDVLSTEALDAEPLGVGVASVTAGRRALLVCHLALLPLLRGDTGDPDLGVLLTVSQTPLVTSLALVLQDLDLGSGHFTEDLSGDLVLVQLGCIADNLAVVHDKQRLEVERVTGLFGHPVDGHHVIDGDLFLSAARSHDRVHRETHFLFATEKNALTIDRGHQPARRPQAAAGIERRSQAREHVGRADAPYFSLPLARRRSARCSGRSRAGCPARLTIIRLQPPPSRRRPPRPCAGSGGAGGVPPLSRLAVQQPPSSPGQRSPARRTRCRTPRWMEPNPPVSRAIPQHLWRYAWHRR